MRKVLILLTGVLVGFIVVLQIRTQENVKSLGSRDKRRDASQEITILVSTNQALRDEVDNLKEENEDYRSRFNSYEQLLEDIQKAEMLAGKRTVQGEGVVIKISEVVSLAELTDLLNEVFQLGVEAIAVNEIRLTNETAGLTAYGEELVFNGEILEAPLEIKVIGNGDLIMTAMEKAETSLDRIRQGGGVEIGLEKRDEVVIKALP